MNTKNSPNKLENLKPSRLIFQNLEGRVLTNAKEVADDKTKPQEIKSVKSEKEIMEKITTEEKAKLDELKHKYEKASQQSQILLERYKAATQELVSKNTGINESYLAGFAGSAASYSIPHPILGPAAFIVLTAGNIVTTLHDIYKEGGYEDMVKLCDQLGVESENATSIAFKAAKEYNSYKKEIFKKYNN